MTKAERIGFRIGLLLQYEPSWFVEFGSALALMGWGVAIFLSDDYDLNWQSCLLPAFCILFAPFRMRSLLELNAVLRVITSMISAIIWCTIAGSLFRRTGFISAEGIILSPLSGDVLTILKFSMIASARRAQREG